MRASSFPLGRFLWAIPLPVLLIALWHFALEQGLIVSIMPTPVEAAKQMWDFAFGGVHDDAYSATLSTHLWASLSRVMIGFGIATALAVPLGILMGHNPSIARAVDPTISLLRPIPVTAWVPLVLLVIGLGSKSAIVLIFIAAFYPILLNTVAGVWSVPGRLMEAAAMLGTRRLAMLYRVVLPAALPSIFAGMRIALGFGWVVVVVGETVGVREGLGAVITEGREISNTELIVAGMAFIGLAGFLTDRLMTFLIRIALKNQPLVGA